MAQVRDACLNSSSLCLVPTEAGVQVTNKQVPLRSQGGKALPTVHDVHASAHDVPTLSYT